MIIDFAVHYDPEKETSEDLTKKIIYSLIVNPLKYKKPRIVFLSGDSGEGKSWGALRLMQILCEIQGINIKDYLDIINVHTPLEYPTKLDKILFDKSCKKINMICMHEAREVIKAKMWYAFLNQAVGDINAMSRSIKRLCIIIISQFIRDISTDIRYTINYYVKSRRPMGLKPRLYWWVMWKDDRDLEKPKLRKRKIRGFLIYPDGKYRKFEPAYLEVNRPDEELIKAFEQADLESKKGIIKKKISKMLKEMKEDLDIDNPKVANMVEWYSTHVEQLQLIGKRCRKKWKIKPEVKAMHDLTDIEVIEFQTKINQKLKDQGVVDDATRTNGT